MFQEIFTEICCLGKERLGNCLFLLDNAAYHKRLVDERHRISFWTKRPAAAVKSAWEAGEVPHQDQATDPPPKTKKAIIQFLREHPTQGKSQLFNELKIDVMNMIQEKQTVIFKGFSLTLCKVIECYFKHKYLWKCKEPGNDLYQL